MVARFGISLPWPVASHKAGDHKGPPHPAPPLSPLRISQPAASSQGLG